MSGLSMRAGLGSTHTYGCTRAQLGDAHAESVALRQLRAQASVRLPVSRRKEFDDIG